MVLEHPWVIPLIHATAFVAILLFGKRLPRRGAELGIASMASSLLLSTWLVVEWINGTRQPHQSQWVWFDYGGFQVHAGTLVDGLTVMMLFVVSLVSLLVQTYSTSYMHDDRRFTHFFAILTFFTAAMQWFVISANTLQMVFGWEVMGLCSFLLIGHWWEEKSNVHAAMKAFLTTRASDIGLIVGVVVLFFAAGGTFDLVRLNERALTGDISSGLLLAGAIALFIAVIGKSAQFPLHTWLPDAMAGPTPMSALIHAATMVVAGVFLVARLFPVFAEAFSIGPHVDAAADWNPIAVIGAITIVIAALLAFVQHDIKKLLSYSTVSQLGYMVLALGVGAWTAAVFHLFTHAFSKALLFLGAGSVSHAVHGFDIEEDMGGLRRTMPITHATFAIGAASLIGIIPLSGFWSKEQITAQAGQNGYLFFEGVALFGAFLTAAYMVRCYYFVFYGEHRGHSHPHESPKTLTIPLVILAAVTVVGGFLQAPALGIELFGDWVAPSYLDHHRDDASIFTPLAIEFAVTAGGIALAVLAFASGIGPRSLARRFKGAKVVYHVLHNRYYLDWLYDKVFVHGIRRGLAWVVHWVDHNLIDNFVDLVGVLTVRLGRFVDRRVDGQLVDGVVRETSIAARGASLTLGRLQNGRVQRYVLLMLGSVAFAAAILVWSQ